MARHLAEYLEASAARYPLRTAVVDSAGESLTYADSIVRHPRSHHFSPRAASAAATAWRIPKGLAAVVSIFGVLKAGAAYVPVDATAPTDRSRRILTDCAIRALIVGGGCLDVAPDSDGNAALAALIAVGENASGMSNATSWRDVLINQINPINPTNSIDPSNLATSSTRRDRRGCQKGR